MDSFTDYYAVLGVDSRATASAIKAAFKKLALQYHPDVYKGADAQERMRTLLLAYQTLSDPASRKTYDAQRSEHFLDSSGRTQTGWQRKQNVDESLSRSANPRPARSSTSSTASSSAGRRDQQRHYDFPDLSNPLATTTQVDLGDVTYQLSPVEACTLQQDGMLRGIASEPQYTGRYYCHRCHHRWTPASTSGHSRSTNARIICPACKASDWSDYLLLRCVHCLAVFESEEIQDKIMGGGKLYHPYELFPLCPQCGASGWCPAEDARVSDLRAQAARRAAILRFIWISAIVAVVLVVGTLAFMLR